MSENNPGKWDRARNFFERFTKKEKLPDEAAHQNPESDLELPQTVNRSSRREQRRGLPNVDVHNSIARDFNVDLFAKLNSSLKQVDKHRFDHIDRIMVVPKFKDGNLDPRVEMNRNSEVALLIPIDMIREDAGNKQVDTNFVAERIDQALETKYVDGKKINPGSIFEARTNADPEIRDELLDNLDTITDQINEKLPSELESTWNQVNEITISPANEEIKIEETDGRIILHIPISALEGDPEQTIEKVIEVLENSPQAKLDRATQSVIKKGAELGTKYNIEPIPIRLSTDETELQKIEKIYELVDETLPNIIQDDDSNWDQAYQITFNPSKKVSVVGDKIIIGTNGLEKKNSVELKAAIIKALADKKEATKVEMQKDTDLNDTAEHIRELLEKRKLDLPDLDKLNLTPEQTLAFLAKLATAIEGLVENPRWATVKEIRIIETEDIETALDPDSNITVTIPIKRLKTKLMKGETIAAQINQRLNQIKTPDTK